MRIAQRCSGLCLGALAMIASSSLCGAQPTIYFSGVPFGRDAGGVYSTVAGSNSVQNLVQTEYYPRPIGVAVNGSNLYWATFEPGGIWRSSLSGNDQTQLVTRSQYSYTRHIEVNSGLMYWNEEGTGAILRAEPNGSNVETVFGGHLGYSDGIWDFTIRNGRAYWTSWISDQVKSTRLDGTDLQTFTLPGANGRRLFSIDSDANGLLVGDMAYDGRDAKVWRVGLNGTGPLLLQTLPNIAEFDSVSIFDDRAYWAYNLGGSSLTAVVQSSRLDGSDLQTELSIVNQVQIFQMTVVPGPAGGVLLGVAVVFSTRRQRTAGR